MPESPEAKPPERHFEKGQRERETRTSGNARIAPE